MNLKMYAILLVAHVNMLIDKTAVYIVVKVQYQMAVLRYVGTLYNNISN